MATESSEGEDEGKIVGGSKHLVVDDDMRETTKNAAWSVSSCKPGNGVQCLRDDNCDTYWQSDGAQPHLINIQFQKKVKLRLIVLYVDLKLDESYTPSKISIRAGDGFHNLKEIKAVELVKPAGWVSVSLSGNDPRETFVNTFMLQIAVLSNHLNGRDTHVRQIKVYGPRPGRRIALVKPEKARGVEDVLLRAAQMGQIVEKVSEERLITLLEQINTQTAKQTKVTIQRRRSVLEDDD